MLHPFSAQEQTVYAKVNVEGPFKGRKRSWCKVLGIPSFVVFVKIGTLITRDGRAAVSGDPTGVDFPWYPKPFRNLKGGPLDINEVTTVLPVCETSDVAAQKAILEAMTPIDEKFIAEANAQGEDSPRIAFFIVTKRRFLPIPEFSGFCGMEEFKNSPLG